MEHKKFGALSSSSDPSKLGDTVTGAILGAGVAIIYLAHKFFGLELGTQEVTEFATSAGAAVSSVWVAYGAVKKVVVWLNDKYRQSKV